MLRYILVLLLINASYRSLGVPINPSSLASSLTALANRCENAFLSNQIKSKVAFCTELSSPHDERQLHCLMFYDINMQLCSAVNAAKIAITEDYTPKITGEQDVNSLCVVAKDWNFSNLTEFLRYKPLVERVFKHSVTCGKICAVEDFMSDDANFFCKYYKWGTEMLQHQVSVPTSEGNIDNNAVSKPAKEDYKPVAPVPNADLQDVQVIKNVSAKDHIDITSPNHVSTQNNQTPKTETSKVETSSLAVNQQSQHAEVANAPEIANTDLNVGVEDTGPMPENPLSVNNQPSKSPQDVAAAAKSEVAQEDTAVKPDVPEGNPIKPEDTLKPDVEKELQLMNNENVKEPVLEGPKVKPSNDEDDYPDSEEGKEGLGDTQGGDDGDGDDPTLVDGEKLEGPKNENKPEANLATFNAERDNNNYYQNPAQDVYPENEDHFFPFFLTAVILVVLLYVLYHNKNKLNKVFFGLVLEGRQAGRRRNSRGHSYRRLDTLEQAMNANTAAPPSKIIY